MDDVIRQILENQHHLRIIERVGRGGFAEVWKAHSAEGVPCAIKVSLDRLEEMDGIFPEEPSRRETLKRELKNLQYLKSLNHPHLVTLMDIWTIGGYLVTRWEYSVEGSLEKRLQYYQAQGQPGIPAEEILRYMEEAAEGIDFLNKGGIYHRDIKPANLLLFSGHLKIGDLGLAKFVGASTGSHTGGGTWGYLPPEAYQGQLSSTVDLYSLAATYLKLRTGREPFGNNPVDIGERQKAGQPDLRGLKRAEAEVVRQALAPNLEDRPHQGACQWVSLLSQAICETKGKQEEVVPEGRKPAPNRAAQPPPPQRKYKTLLVDPWGQGEVRTLEEAIECVMPGGTVRLAEGTHQLHQPLLITEPVSLEGAGMDRTRILCEGADYVIKFAGSGRFMASGLTFQHVGNSPADVVAVTSGDIVIERCRFQGGVLGKWQGCGLRLGGTVWGTVRQCEAVHNAKCGILVEGQAQPILEENLCSENKGSGIIYAGSAAGTARKNLCTKNREHGIYVGRRAKPNLEENTCSENKRKGIAYKPAIVRAILRAIVGAIVWAIVGAIGGAIVGAIGGAIYGAIGGAIVGAILAAIGGVLKGAEGKNML